jgi:hypothetical protein
VKGSVGASDVALTLDGPLGENTSYILSASHSYLQFLFSALGLPFLPTYDDFQFKTKTFEMKVIGHSHYSGKTGELFSDISTLTTALNIVKSTQVTLR